MGNLIEETKLICDFMEYRLGNGTKKDPVLYIEVPMWYGGTSTKALTWFHFNKDYNSLMQVLEKIENLSFNDRKVWTTIKTFNTSRDENYHEMSLRIYDSKSKDSKYLLEFNSEFYDTKIECIYYTVLEFIKWYNENKKQT